MTNMSQYKLLSPTSAGESDDLLQGKTTEEGMRRTVAHKCQMSVHKGHKRFSGFGRFYSSGLFYWKGFAHDTERKCGSQ